MADRETLVERCVELAKSHLEIDGDGEGPFIRFDSIENAVCAVVDEAASELSRLNAKVEELRATISALEAENKRLREAVDDFDDEDVVAAMKHIPGCDHDDMVSAVEAFLASRRARDLSRNRRETP